MEIRIKDAILQCGDNNKLEIGGYINVTERQSEMLFSEKRNKWFKEVMRKGVFQRAINKAKEIPLLLEHNYKDQLASTSEGTLELCEDNIGLKFKAVIENRAVYDQVKAGIINACSFGFKVLGEKIEGVNDRFEKRFVDDIELREVSLVKNPAYVGSLVETRAMLEEEIKNIDIITEELSKESETENQDEERAKKSSKEKEAVNKDSEDKDSEDKDDSIENDGNSQKEFSENSESSDDSKEESEDEKKDEENSKGKSEDEDESKEENDSDNSDDSDKKNPKDSKEKRALVGTDQSELMSKDELKSFVDELIQSKLQEVQMAESIVEDCNNALEQAKQVHEEIENSIADDCMRYNWEVVKLRTQLMKLNQIKKL